MDEGMNGWMVKNTSEGVDGWMVKTRMDEWVEEVGGRMDGEKHG